MHPFDIQIIAVTRTKNTKSPASSARTTIWCVDGCKSSVVRIALISCAGMVDPWLLLQEKAATTTPVSNRVLALTVRNCPAPAIMSPAS